jgi:hypothetical protein
VQALTLCALQEGDADWANAVCSQLSYPLSAPLPEVQPAPQVVYWSDDATIVAGRCTNLHWLTYGADSVSINGIALGSSGDAPVCPTATSRYTLTASGPGGETTRAISVAVTSPALQPVQSVTAQTTSTQACTNDADLVAEVTIPDTAEVAPGGSFTKAWRIRNTGSCTWDVSYALAFVGGEQLGAPNFINLQQNVAPGETTDITPYLVAPGLPGSYRGYWQLRSGDGVLFSPGFRVDIVVPALAGPTFADGGVAFQSSAPWVEPVVAGLSGPPTEALSAARLDDALQEQSGRLVVNDGSSDSPRPWFMLLASSFVLALPFAALRRGPR